MSDSFVDGFCIRLEGLLSQDQIKSVKDLLSIYTLGYEISPVKADLIVQDYQLPQAYYVYMAAKSQDGRMKKGGHRQYAMCIEKMLWYFRIPLESYTVNHIRLYIHEISVNPRTGKPLSKATLNQRKCIIRSFFHWLYEEEYITKDPSTRIKPEKSDSQPRTAFRDIQIELLRNACKERRTRALIDLLSSSGIRVAECAVLT